MSMRRQAIVDQLCASDHFDHLRIYAPVIDGSVVVNVHSKVMIVDDTFLRVGSANLSNRSMAVDTECDVALAATDDDTAAGIAAVRDGLLAEHLGATPAEVATTMAETRSLIGAIARLRGRVHTLEPLPTRAPGWLDGLPDEAHVFDPTEPIDAGRLLAQLLPVPAAGAPRSRDGFVTGVVSFATVIAIGFGLRWLGARIFPRPSPTGSAGAHV
jgi:hypothetical protein